MGIYNKNIIKNTAKKYRIFRDNKFKKNIKKYTKESLLESLQQGILEAGRVPMLCEFPQYGIPCEVTYRRYFGSVTKAVELLGYDRPHYEFLITSGEVLYDDQKNPCYSITEQRISNFLIAKGYPIEKEYLYSNVIKNEPRCKTKRFDWKIGDYYIEYFGLMGYHGYEESVQVKLELCKNYNIKLLPLFPDDMKSDAWQQKIINFLK